MYNLYTTTPSILKPCFPVHINVTLTCACQTESTVRRITSDYKTLTHLLEIMLHEESSCWSWLTDFSLETLVARFSARRLFSVSNMSSTEPWPGNAQRRQMKDETLLTDSVWPLVIMTLCFRVRSSVGYFIIISYRELFINVYPWTIYKFKQT